MWIDLTILILLFLSIVNGYRNGLSHTLSCLAGWIMAIAAGYFLWEHVNRFLRDTLGIEAFVLSYKENISSVLIDFIIIVISIIVILIIVKLLSNIFLYLLKSTIFFSRPGKLNSLFGAVFGGMKCVIIIWVITAFLLPFAAELDIEFIDRSLNASRALPILCEYNPLTEVIEGDYIIWN